MKEETKLISMVVDKVMNGDEAFIAQLKTLGWNNCLSQEEAESVIAKMCPSAKWPDFDEWKSLMDDGDYEYSEAPFYNCYALWVAMSMIYSDHADTICKIAGRPKDSIECEEMFSFVYLLAVDLLKDEDKNFGIRKYFCMK